MSEKIVKLFISTGLFSLVIGCIEGVMFPIKMQFQSFYSTLFHIPPELIKGFSGHFVAQKSKKAPGGYLAKAALAGILTLGLVLPLSPAMASPAKVAKPLPVIIIGDRLADTAHSLGVVPSAMAVRCALWPLCDTLKSSVQVLGCPGCLLKKKAVPLFKYAEKHGIKQILIEKSSQFCEYMPDLDLEKIGALVTAKGYDVKYVDFSQGLEQAVNQTAELTGTTDKAGSVMEKYRKEMDKTRAFIASNTFVKKVVIIRGTYQATSGKTFLRIEAPQGYADKFLLDPLGVKNAGHLAVPKGKTVSKGHIQVRKLNGLIKVAPDAIIITGDAVAVQKAIGRAVKQNPALAEVPALRDHLLFNLPGYVDGSVMEYPGILKRWADLLAR